jgi:uncharacterized protein YbjT (DUF2867 family)
MYANQGFGFICYNSPVMILVTGGTGFIGQVLVRQLILAKKDVRMLIRPSIQTPNLPRGVPVEVAICSLKDERGLRAAMKNIEAVYHLVGVESRGNRANLMEIDIQGTQAVAQAAADAGVGRFFYLSQLGADRASAFPVLKAKAIAEHSIRSSGLNYTIVRSAVVFGANDHFTTGLAVLLHGLPGFLLVPGDGGTVLQPLWVEDLATALVWALDDPNTNNMVYQVGGPEYLRFREIVEMVAAMTGVQRKLVPLAPAVMRYLTVFLEQSFPAFPVSIFWMDYLATNRTCALDTLPRAFGLVPARFGQRLDYLKGQKWNQNLWRWLFRRRRR